MSWKGVERRGGRNGASERSSGHVEGEVDHEKRKFSPTDAQGNRMRGRGGGGREEAEMMKITRKIIWEGGEDVDVCDDGEGGGGGGGGSVGCGREEKSGLHKI